MITIEQRPQDNASASIFRQYRCTSDFTGINIIGQVKT
jgi:hypothetical protein